MTKEQIFADFFNRNAHGDKSIMKEMLKVLLKGNNNKDCNMVILKGYDLAMHYPTYIKSY